MYEEILAIDPGNIKSGYVYVTENPRVPGGMTIEHFGVLPNAEIREMIEGSSINTNVIMETPRPQGMPTASEVMDTLLEIGRFVEISGQRPWGFAFRGKIKLHLCGSVTAKDPNVRQALIDYFGGDSVAVGNKKCQTCHGKGTRGVTKLDCDVCKGACRIATDKECVSCKGHGNKLTGAKSDRVVINCEKCGSTGKVQVERNCQNCNGKGTKGTMPTECHECSGSGWEFPPGPLHGVTSHVWPALAVALWWLDTREEIQKITLVDSSKLRQERERNASNNGL
jgi:hypothetical protein